jgi:hypothetical protein
MLASARHAEAEAEAAVKQEREREERIAKVQAEAAAAAAAVAAEAEAAAEVAAEVVAAAETAQEIMSDVEMDTCDTGSGSSGVGVGGAVPMHGGGGGCGGCGGAGGSGDSGAEAGVAPEAAEAAGSAAAAGKVAVRESHGMRMRPRAETMAHAQRHSGTSRNSSVCACASLQSPPSWAARTAPCSSRCRVTRRFWMRRQEALPDEAERQRGGGGRSSIGRGRWRLGARGK